MSSTATSNDAVARGPDRVAQFLRLRRIAVIGVSRDPHQPANAIYRKLRGAGFDVVAVNPRAVAVEGDRCFPDLAEVPGSVDGVVVVTPPDAALDIVRQCGRFGIRHVWFHRSFGEGSVAADAVAEAGKLGLQTIVGGCPMMYCKPVDPAHWCMAAFLRWRGRVP